MYVISYICYFLCSRFGSKTDEPSGGNGRETSKQSCVRTASVRSSMDSCSRTTTCIPATRTTTGPPRASRPPPYPPKASPSSTPWTSTLYPRRPCSRRPTPSPPWPPAWCHPLWPACRDPAWTASITWTTSVTLPSTLGCLRRRAPTRRRPLPTCTETLVTPAWPAWDWKPSSTRVLDTPGFRIQPPIWALASTRWTGRSNCSLHCKKSPPSWHVRGQSIFNPTKDHFELFEVLKGIYCSPGNHLPQDSTFPSNNRKNLT